MTISVPSKSYRVRIRPEAAVHERRLSEAATPLIAYSKYDRVFGATPEDLLTRSRALETHRGARSHEIAGLADHQTLGHSAGALDRGKAGR
jgi:hypothetical protein